MVSKLFVYNIPWKIKIPSCLFDTKLYDALKQRNSNNLCCTMLSFKNSCCTWPPSVTILIRSSDTDTDKTQTSYGKAMWSWQMTMSSWILRKFCWDQQSSIKPNIDFWNLSFHFLQPQSSSKNHHAITMEQHRTHIKHRTTTHTTRGTHAPQATNTNNT